MCYVQTKAVHQFCFMFHSAYQWSVPPPSPLQELASLGFSLCIEANSPGRGALNTVAALNAMYELLQIHRRNMNTLEELEKEHLKKTSSLEHMQMNNSRLKVRTTAVSSNLPSNLCVFLRLSNRFVTTRGQCINIQDLIQYDLIFSPKRNKWWLLHRCKT